MLGYYTHNYKNENYFVESVVSDQTPGRDFDQMVLYYPCGKDNIPLWNSAFVMSYIDFLENFSKAVDLNV
jgi:hypothetical protein